MNLLKSLLEQGDLFNFAGPDVVGTGFGNNESEWTEKAEIGTRKKFLAVAEAYVAISVLQGYLFTITLDSSEERLTRMTEKRSMD